VKKGMCVVVFGEPIVTKMRSRIAAYSIAQIVRMSSASWMPYSARDPG